MKALTICQPYAELILLGRKRVENRTWPTSYRGLLGIHAGKSRDWLLLDDEQKIDIAYDLAVAEMAFGAMVGQARLIDCLPYETDKEQRRAQDKYPWMADHAHATGPYCWVLADVRRLERPVPCRGMQGLWDTER